MVHHKKFIELLHAEAHWNDIFGVRKEKEAFPSLGIDYAEW